VSEQANEWRAVDARYETVAKGYEACSPPMLGCASIAKGIAGQARTAAIKAESRGNG